MDKIGLDNIVWIPRDNNAFIHRLDFLQLSHYLLINLVISFTIPIRDAFKDLSKLNDFIIKFVGNIFCDFDSILLVIAVQGYNLSFVPLLKVIDEILNGVLWLIKSEGFC